LHNGIMSRQEKTANSPLPVDDCLLMKIYKLRALAPQKNTNVITNVTSEWTETYLFHFFVLHNGIMSRQEKTAKSPLPVDNCLLMTIGLNWALVPNDDFMMTSILALAFSCIN
jgi:hypothetical protein